MKVNLDLLLSRSDLLEQKLLLKELDLLCAHLRQLEALRNRTRQIGHLLELAQVLLLKLLLLLWCKASG